MLYPLVVLLYWHFCVKAVRFCDKTNSHVFYENTVVELGSVSPHTGAVYFHCWCSVFEHDGSDLMLLSVLVCVWLRLGMFSPMVMMFLCMFLKTVRFFFNANDFYEKAIVQLGSVSPHTCALY